MRKRAIVLLTAMGLTGPFWTPPGSSPAGPMPRGPIPAISRVLLISVDGLRPDLILRSNTPNLRGLMARGSYSFWARTTDLAVTLPSHASMVTGLTPAKHGIDWNSTVPANRDSFPKGPTLFDLARANGFTTAMATGKSKFRFLTRRSSLDRCFVPAEAVTHDAVVADSAVRWIATFAPRVLFVHLPGVDVAGHEEGWGSPAQIEAVGTADRCIGRVLDALRSQGVLDSTLVLVTADHGGAGKSHGPDDPRSRMIPWIVAGPGVCEDTDLTTHATLSITTEDTFATLLYALGIPRPSSMDGKAVLQIFCSGSRAVQH